MIRSLSKQEKSIINQCLMTSVVVLDHSVFFQCYRQLVRTANRILCNQENTSVCFRWEVDTCLDTSGTQLLPNVHFCSPFYRPQRLPNRHVCIHLLTICNDWILRSRTMQQAKSDWRCSLYLLEETFSNTFIMHWMMQLFRKYFFLLLECAESCWWIWTD